ncbi:glycosyltransferase [Ollibium composti]|uniref:glycosyltransferase n=1 Tax=Ollibium composti TaxID=2675109 RepID=UPI001454BA17|nr:glycosyltransferase [Mesorhizobium composti]
MDRAFSSDPTPQVSAVNFEMALLDGLAANGANIRIIGALPVASYPRCKRLVVIGAPFSTVIGGVSGVLATSLNLPLVKLGIRLLTSLYHGRRMLRRGIGRNGIIVYSLHTPYVAAALWLKRLYRVPVAVFIPDLPLHMSGKRSRGLHGAIKGLDDRLLRHLMEKVDFAFPITEGVARSWLPTSLPYHVVEGIAPVFVPSSRRPRSRGQARPRILYTGSFSHIHRVVQLFAARPDLDAELVLVGGGPDLEALQQLATQDMRIKIKPFVVGEALQREFDAADFLINPRDPQWMGAQFSFPSKLFDYMTRKLPILSTRMPGIPPEYFNCFFALDEQDEIALATSLEKALAAGSSEIEARIAAGERLLSTDKSAKVVGARILKALS